MPDAVLLLGRESGNSDDLGTVFRSTTWGREGCYDFGRGAALAARYDKRLSPTYTFVLEGAAIFGSTRGTEVVGAAIGRVFLPRTSLHSHTSGSRRTQPAFLSRSKGPPAAATFKTLTPRSPATKPATPYAADRSLPAM